MKTKRSVIALIIGSQKTKVIIPNVPEIQCENSSIICLACLKRFMTISCISNNNDLAALGVGLYQRNTVFLSLQCSASNLCKAFPW